MLLGVFKKEDHCERTQKDATRGFTLIMLSIATSIDALAVGFSLSIINATIIVPAVIIGVVAFFFTMAGLHLGKIISRASGLSAITEIIGGLVLWAIGVNILYEHNVFTG